MINEKQKAIIGAVAEMGLMKYFPSDEFTRAALLTMLDRMCESAESVQWLGRHMCAKYTDWPGAAVVRGVYCSRYPPADGIDANLPSSDVTFQEAEQRSIAQSQEFKTLSASAPNVRALLQAATDPLEAERKTQDGQWSALCRKYPVPRVFRTLATEFATGTVKRRGEILKEIHLKLSPVLEHMASNQAHSGPIAPAESPGGVRWREDSVNAQEG